MQTLQSCTQRSDQHKLNLRVVGIFSLILYTVSSIPITSIDNITTGTFAPSRHSVSVCNTLVSVNKQCDLFSVIDQQYIDDSISDFMKTCKGQVSCVAFVNSSSEANTDKRCMCRYAVYSNDDMNTLNTNSIYFTSETCWTKQQNMSTLVETCRTQSRHEPAQITLSLDSTDNTKEVESDQKCLFFHTKLIGCDPLRYAFATFLFIITILLVSKQQTCRNNDACEYRNVT